MSQNNLSPLKVNTQPRSLATATHRAQEVSQDQYDPHQMLGFSRQWQSNSAGVNDAPQKITYDTLGRVVTDADGNTLHYNSFGQMDRFTNHHTHEHTTYTYDSDGHQIAEQPFDANNQPLQAPLYMMYQGNTITAHKVTIDRIYARYPA